MEHIKNMGFCWSLRLLYFNRMVVKLTKNFDQSPELTTIRQITTQVDTFHKPVLTDFQTSEVFPSGLTLF
jgi:hypothetical protein